jgi:hypothetical protein
MTRKKPAPHLMRGGSRLSEEIMLKRWSFGAIAQLGERLHGMQEVGGSIPPGSTTLRLRLRVAQPRKSRRRNVPGIAQRATTGLGTDHFSVITSAAKQSMRPAWRNGLLRRFAPRKDGTIARPGICEEASLMLNAISHLLPTNFASNTHDH